MKKYFKILLLLFLAYLLIGTSLPFRWHKEVSEEFQEEFQNELEESFGNEGGSGERISYISDNTDAMIYRLQMLEAAQEEIILSTFDFNGDDAGQDMISALLAAADRGVSVKVIVDGVSGLLDFQILSRKWFQALAEHENVEVKVYSPIHLLKPWKFQTRLHDKYIIIDNSMYILGGRNIMNLFLGDYGTRKNTDGDVFVYIEEEKQNNSLEQLRSYFDEIWNLSDSKEYVCRSRPKKVQKTIKELQDRQIVLRELYPEAYQEPEWMDVTYPVNSIMLLHNPTAAVNKEPELWYGLNQYMLAGDSVIIHTPYIICSKQMYRDLTKVCENSDTVEIITNDIIGGANPWGCTDYLNEQKNILRTGVTVYEYLGEYSKHSKMVLVDDRISIIGSFNFDMRSAYLDTELMLVIDSEELNASLKQGTLEEMEYSRFILEGEEYQNGTLYEEQNMGFFKKVVYIILRVFILPIRHLL